MKYKTDLFCLVPSSSSSSSCLLPPPLLCRAVLFTTPTLTGACLLSSHSLSSPSPPLSGLKPQRRLVPLGLLEWILELSLSGSDWTVWTAGIVWMLCPRLLHFNTKIQEIITSNSKNKVRIDPGDKNIITVIFIEGHFVFVRSLNQLLQ